MNIFIMGEASKPLETLNGWRIGDLTFRDNDGRQINYTSTGAKWIWGEHPNVHGVATRYSPWKTGVSMAGC